MDPTPYFIMGMLTGTGGLLLIQAYARRTVRKALAARPPENDEPIKVAAEQAPELAMVREMRRRVEVLEQIVTEQPLRLEREIERLR